MGLFSFIASIGTKVGRAFGIIGRKAGTHISNIGGKVKKMPDLWKASVPRPPPVSVGGFKEAVKPVAKPLGEITDTGGRLRTRVPFN
jgi:hypothetical protein